MHALHAPPPLPGLNVPAPFGPAGTAHPVHVLGVLLLFSESCPAAHSHVRSTCASHGVSTTAPAPHTVHGKHSPSHAPFDVSHLTVDAASVWPPSHTHTSCSSRELFGAHDSPRPSWHGSDDALPEK